MQLDRLVRVIPTGRPGNPKSLPDDVLKVQVHVGYESAGGGKRKAPDKAGAIHRGYRGLHPALYPAGARRAWVGTTGRAPGT